MPTLEDYVHVHPHQVTRNEMFLPSFSPANWRIRRKKGGEKEGGTEWGEENVGRIFEELQVLKGLSVCRDNCIPL